MNGAYVHLLLNHVPILATFFGTAVLALGALRASDEMKRLGLLVFVVAALVTLPVQLSGEKAEDVVEHLPGVEHDLIEEHEEAVPLAAACAYALGALSLVGLAAFRSPTRLPPWLVGAALVLSLVSGGLMARVGALGGEIRHSEVRSAP